MHRLFDAWKWLWSAKLVRFLFVGVLNTMVGYLLYAAFVAIGLAPGLSLALATIAGAVFNYFSTGRVVFRHAGTNRLPHFLAAYLVIYLANLAALQSLLSLGVPAYYSQAALLPAVAFASFLIFKFFVFRTTDATHDA